MSKIYSISVNRVLDSANKMNYRVQGVLGF